MVRDAQATRRRLLDAAAEEFSVHGIAGARVDRIAAAARSNKAQIYHYFGSKDRLFDAVMDDIVAGTAGEVPVDARNLPEWAGRLFDRYEDHPHITRLAMWYRLERTVEGARIEPLADTIHEELEQIRLAQVSGEVPARYRPADLLNLVLHLTFLWAFVFPELQGHLRGASRRHRRQVLTDAVASLLKDEDGASAGN
ncbi:MULTISPECIES: TetR family transcriptional regulator [unclassified Streptomyces]|uniref:TetR family transcriptional regulator n=1 Tax=unclassified Streptomyces TaxID=2593676 RepID=UPI00380C2FDD